MCIYALPHLADHVLLRDLATVVARDRATTAQLLAHLGEVDARKLAALKSKSEVEQLLAQRFPRPELATVLQALGPAPAPAPGGPVETRALDRAKLSAPGRIDTRAGAARPRRPLRGRGRGARPRPGPPGPPARAP